MDLRVSKSRRSHWSRRLTDLDYSNGNYTLPVLVQKDKQTATSDSNTLPCRALGSSYANTKWAERHSTI